MQAQGDVIGLSVPGRADGVSMCCGERMLAMDSWSAQRGGLGLVLMLVGQDVGRASRPSDPQIRYGAGLWMAGCERAQRGGSPYADKSRVAGANQHAGTGEGSNPPRH